jgi:ATP-dependent phosphofructokinase / diphosphate-dependent phosphofructokinase
LRAKKERDWEVVGSINAFDGVLHEPNEIMILGEKEVAGIHIRGAPS